MSIDSAKDETNANLTKLADAIVELGYRAKIEDDVIVSSAGGMKVSVQLYGDDSVQLASGFRGLPTGFGFEQINEYNRKYRFGSIYQQEPGTVVLQSNFLLDPDDSHFKDKMEAIFSLVEGLIVELREAIAEFDDTSSE
jgi:hypothetical protein